MVEKAQLPMMPLRLLKPVRPCSMVWVGPLWQFSAASRVLWTLSHTRH